ncbi:hypothetical protein A5787_20885 [Mycobacterium sp. 852002-50816_SCH5313054-b]|nr:hypothetical protein A5787_20885 [Mycobacterium sp. 852002-50816_SCH5313054-b]
MIVELIEVLNRLSVMDSGGEVIEQAAIRIPCVHHGCSVITTSYSYCEYRGLRRAGGVFPVSESSKF